MISHVSLSARHSGQCWHHATTHVLHLHSLHSFGILMFSLLSVQNSGSKNPHRFLLLRTARKMRNALCTSWHNPRSGQPAGLVGCSILSAFLLLLPPKAQPRSNVNRSSRNIWLATSNIHLHLSACLHRPFPCTSGTATKSPAWCILPAPAYLPAVRGVPIQSWLYTSLIFASHRAPSGGCFTLRVFAPTDGKRNEPQFRRISCLYVLFNFWMLTITSASQSAVNRTVKHQIPTCSALLHFSVSL